VSPLQKLVTRFYQRSRSKPRRALMPNIFVVRGQSEIGLKTKVASITSRAATVAFGCAEPCGNRCSEHRAIAARPARVDFMPAAAGVGHLAVATRKNGKAAYVFLRRRPPRIRILNCVKLSVGRGRSITTQQTIRRCRGATLTFVLDTIGRPKRRNAPGQFLKKGRKISFSLVQPPVGGGKLKSSAVRAVFRRRASERRAARRDREDH